MAGRVPGLWQHSELSASCGAADGACRSCLHYDSCQGGAWREGLHGCRDGSGTGVCAGSASRRWPPRRRVRFRARSGPLRSAPRNARRGGRGAISIGMRRPTDEVECAAKVCEAVRGPEQRTRGSAAAGQADRTCHPDRHGRARACCSEPSRVRYRWRVAPGGLRGVVERGTVPRRAAAAAGTGHGFRRRTGVRCARPGRPALWIVRGGGRGLTAGRGRRSPRERGGRPGPWRPSCPRTGLSGFGRHLGGEGTRSGSLPVAGRRPAPRGLQSRARPDNIAAFERADGVSEHRWAGARLRSAAGTRTAARGSGGRRPRRLGHDRRLRCGTVHGGTPCTATRIREARDGPTRPASDMDRCGRSGTPHGAATVGSLAARTNLPRTLTGSAAPSPAGPRRRPELR